MSTIKVDTDALAALRSQLLQVREALDTITDDVDAAGDLGSARIEDALHDFVSGWRDGRKKLTKSIDNMIGRIEQAVQAYDDNEQAIVDNTEASLHAGG